jgi:hypothetical protein
MVYKFNNERLVFERTYKVVKYKAISTVLLLALGGTLVSSMKLNTEKEYLEKVVKQREKRIALIKQPLREETYVEDLSKSIGFSLTKDQYETFEKLALRYRDKLEEAKIPATLVWWVSYKESRFDVDAKSKSSTAKGQFQFLDGTWNEMCKLKGTSKRGRFNEEKQVDIMITYLNYLYNKYGNWEQVMKEYHGGNYQYPVTFLLK